MVPLWLREDGRCSEDVVRTVMNCSSHSVDKIYLFVPDNDPLQVQVVESNVCSSPRESND
jgi:hypothetical protein